MLKLISEAPRFETICHRLELQSNICYIDQQLYINAETELQKNKSKEGSKDKKKTPGLSPPANYNDRATAASRRS
jgi:hypothetical protein